MPLGSEQFIAWHSRLLSGWKMEADMKGEVAERAHDFKPIIRHDEHQTILQVAFWRERRD